MCVWCLRRLNLVDGLEVLSTLLGGSFHGWYELKELLHDHQVSFSHIRRVANSEVDSLTKKGVSCSLLIAEM